MKQRLKLVTAIGSDRLDSERELAQHVVDAGGVVGVVGIVGIVDFVQGHGFVMRRSSGSSEPRQMSLRLGL